jgi:phosphate transport system permease protein
MINSLTVKKQRMGEKAAYAAIFTVSALLFAVVLYFVWTILRHGLPVLSRSFLTTAPNPILETVGIFPSIVNTLYVVLLSLIICVPLGVGGAIYLNEYAKHRKLKRLIEFGIEILTGIPSVIYGIFGYVFFCVFLNLKVSLLAGSLTLCIMAFPILIRTTQEALTAVPKQYREGAMGLGATRWTVIRTILLPSSLKGILTGVLLSVGRMISESAALLLTAGGSAMYLPKGNVIEQLSGSGSTLSVELYRYATSRGDNETAFGIAAVLVILVIGLNLLIRLVARRLTNDWK